MSRRPSPHLYQEDPGTRGTCARCHLIKRHVAHVPADQLPANPAAELEARRLGEHLGREDDTDG